MNRPADGWICYALGPRDARVMGEGRTPDAARADAARRYRDRRGGNPLRVSRPLEFWRGAPMRGGAR